MSGALQPSRLLPPEARFASLEVDDTGFESLEPLKPGEGPTDDQRWAQKRLREFRAGRQVAREVLAALGHPAHLLIRDADGVPSYPSGIAASITHTGMGRTFAAAAALPGARGLGIDAEETRSLSDDVTARILSSEEREALSRQGALGELALLAFSAKEAFYKCVFPRVRHFLEFQDVRFELLEMSDVLAERSGSFVVSSEKCRAFGGPKELPGRFVWARDRVLTAVAWE